VAGGTGLYLRALLVGLFEGPPRDEALRRRLEALGDRFGDERLHRLLRRVDPAAAGRIGPRDRVRVVRALEVYRVTGHPISEGQRRGSEPLRGYRTIVVGLDPGRAALRAAIEARTRQMLAQGLVDEVRGLLSRGTDPLARPLQAIGYRQALSVLRGEMRLEDAEGAIVSATLRFAKRQMTWFRHQEDVRWFAHAGEAREAVHAWLEAPPPANSLT
jgi:tRNA dimethylallyltransferase